MEDVLTQLTRQFLPQMTAAEKSRALRSLKALIDAELFDLAASEGAEDDPDRACPWCGSPHYVKRGETGAAVSGSSAEGAPGPSPTPPCASSPPPSSTGRPG